MPVRDDMLNGHGICHGGFIATLADSAFAFACNAGNVVTVASGLSVEFLRPVQGGDVLTAAAVEVSSAGRTGVWDMTVTNGAGDRVALVRGKAHRLLGRAVMPVDPSVA
jgi:acyl-CoA thioesterase